jgi:hypothetical protein
MRQPLPAAFATASSLAASLATAGAALLISGCATRAPATEVDSLYVARVEHAAKRMGTTVIWVNYPQKPVSAVPAEPAKK